MSARPLPLPPVELLTRDDFLARPDRLALGVTSVITLIALLNAIGLLAALGRIFSPLGGGLPLVAMLPAAILTTATVFSIRVVWRRLFPLEEQPSIEDSPSVYDWDAVVGWGCSSALILIAVGCCYPASFTSDWLIWLPALVADQFLRQTFFDAGEPTRLLDPDLIEFDRERDEELAATLAFRSDEDFESALCEASSIEDRADGAEQIVQRLYRVRDEQGQEVVYGTVRADFKAGQRTAVVHVGFCPPLSHVPKIEAESLPGSPSRIKIVQALAHGTRLDVRLPAPAESDRHVWIDMAATPAG